MTLHACRHLHASVSIAAGVNAHSLCTYMGPQRDSGHARTVRALVPPATRPRRPRYSRRTSIEHSCSRPPAESIQQPLTGHPATAPHKNVGKRGVEETSERHPSDEVV